MEDKEENLSDNFISRWSKRKARNNIKHFFISQKLS